jgi:hypothetical protein
MNVKLLITFAALVLSAAPLAVGQKRQPTPPCTLTLEDSPVIRGLQLGMSFEEFNNIFPDVKPEPPNADTAVGKVGYYVRNRGVEFHDVYISTSAFVDNKLSYLAIIYSDFEPTSPEDFVRQAVEKLSLPSTGWGRRSPGSRFLKCAEFTVYIQSGQEGFKQTDPAIVLIDTKAEALVESRKKELIRQEQLRRKEEEKRRRVFKP